MDPLFETAYPQLKDNLTSTDIEDILTPSPEEISLANSVSGKVPAARLGFLLHLKLFQRLGRFLKLTEIPAAAHQYMANAANIRRTINKKQLADYERSGTQQRHFEKIRDILRVRVVDGSARVWLETVAAEAATTKNAENDIVNIMLENLIKERYELPGLTTIQRIARSARDKVNNDYYQKIISPLTAESRKLLDSLFVVSKDSSQSTWQALKREPAKPTNKEVRQYLQHVQRLIDLVEQLPPVKLPVAKLRYFRQVARSQDAAQMAKLTATRRYALAIIFIRSQFSKTLDDTGTLFSRLFRNLENNAQEALKQYQLVHIKRTDELIVQLKSILTTYQAHDELETRHEALAKILPSDIDVTIAECEEHLAYAGNNFLPFMLKPYHSVRSLLLNCLDILSPRSSTSDKLTERLLLSLQTLRKCRLEIIDPVMIQLNPEKDFTWLSEKWRKLVIIKTDDKKIYLHRKYYELASLQRIKNELGNLDLYVEYSDEFNDYREQLVDDETYVRELPLYGELAGISTDSKEFCQNLKDLLTSTAQLVDNAFPENSSAEIIKGKLVLRKPEKSPLSVALKELDKKITESLPENSIVDVLTDTEKWLQLHKLFGPLSESKGRLDDPEMRFITTLFCYGCNLGPSQTAKSVKGLSRKQVAWLNLKNATEDRIDKAIFKVTNAYNKFKLPCYWGTGKHASVDGTIWNLYEQNLVSEYHIRYGAYGGIGYYLVSDKYIALFSHFIPCGVYEGNYIIDLLVNNESDIQPDVVHGDTHAQNYPVFALTYLLGIQLMPRIRGVNNLSFAKPDKKQTYKHINSLFSESIDWKMIEKFLPDMLRVAISIKLGTITASTILKRLGTASRNNKLYYAFRELGKAVRTIFLLRYINDVELRRSITAATNKSEEYNGFVKWVFFGGEGIIAENLQHEQRKIIKYNHLVSSMLMLHNVVKMTELIKNFQHDGMDITPELLAGLSPFRTSNINRFGDYIVNLEREVQPLDYNVTFFE